MERLDERTRYLLQTHDEVYVVLTKNQYSLRISDTCTIAATDIKLLPDGQLQVDILRSDSVLIDADDIKKFTILKCEPVYLR